MKYLYLIVGVAVVYFVLARQAPVAPVTEALASHETAIVTGPKAAPTSQPASTNSLKSPIDRTHAVLEQAQARNGAGEF